MNKNPYHAATMGEARLYSGQRRPSKPLNSKGKGRPKVIPCDFRLQQMRAAHVARMLEPEPDPQPRQLREVFDNNSFNSLGRAWNLGGS